MTDHHKPEQAWNIEFDDEKTWATLEGEIGPRVIGGNDSPTFRFYSYDIIGKDPPLPKDHGERYETVLEHCRYAGTYALERMTDTGEMRYREQHTGPSLLVKCEPEYDAPGATGVWALISGYDDATQDPSTMCVVTLDLEILASADEYDSHQDARRMHEMGGF